MRKNNNTLAFTLVEMLMALLIVSVILSASMPVITKRMKAQVSEYGKNVAVPIGMIAIWGTDKALPDNTWLECNGQAIPNGIEYEEIRQIYGTNLPDYRGVFLRGHGTYPKALTQTWQDLQGTSRSVTTTYSSASVGEIQGDTSREIHGILEVGWGSLSGFDFFYRSPDTATGVRAATLATDSETQQWANRLRVSSSRVVPTSGEIRPVNTAVRYIIKVRN